MKSVEELDHYELLELSPDARQDEVERAYSIVRAAYERDSLALYSVFDSRDSSAIRDRIDLAYHVLSDPHSRRRYDEALGVDRKKQPPTAQRPSVSARAFDEAAAAALDTADAQAEAVPEQLDIPVVQQATEVTYQELADEESGEYDGAKLRRERMRRGVELDEISQITKVNPKHLENIEHERFDDLPDAVYVRGYVVAYARTLRLDAPAVAHSFMARVEAHRAEPPRTRLLGRR